jgi:hypothetical protein
MPGAATSRAVAYSACIRSHCVPNFPDPDSSGQVPKADPQALGVSSTQLQAAQQACQHLYPSNGRTLSASSLRQCYESGVCPQVAVNAGLKFARCMLPRQAWVGGIGAALLIGALAGLLPAIRAARFSPTQALWSI